MSVWINAVAQTTHCTHLLHLDTIISHGIILPLDVAGDGVGNRLSSFALKLEWINDL